MNSCFYCGEYTHLVYDCIDPEILQLYDVVKNIYLATRTTENHRINQHKFMEEISQRRLNGLISLAIKYAHAMYNYPFNDDYYIMLLWHHFESDYMRNIQDFESTFTDLNINFQIDRIGQPQEQEQREQEQHTLNTINFKHNFITTIETGKYSWEQEEECPICLDNVKSTKFVKLNCNHRFCIKCVIKSIKTNKKKIHSCALCRCATEMVRVYDVDTYELVRQL